MPELLWSDVSHFQSVVDDRYPYPFLAFRANDGTYRDRNCAANLAWSKAAVQKGKLTGFIVYFVWEPNWQATVDTLKSMVGTPDPHMAVMIDVENWSGRITGNQSAGINAAREAVISWLGGNRKRVIGYGNRSDLANLWPNRGDAQVIVANYSGVPTGIAGMIGHQYADNANTPPFGPSDINRAEMTANQFAALLGLPVPSDPQPEPTKPPKPQPDIPTGDEEGMYIIVQNNQSNAIALVAPGLWQPLNYGDNPITADDIKVLLGMPLCKSSEVITMSPARYGIMKSKIAGVTN